jgi:predicted RNA-binding protein with PIN domain
MYNEEWTEYYVYLEELRQSGVTNMFGAVPYLTSEFPHIESARKVLMSWMSNYEKLVDDGIIVRSD